MLYRKVFSGITSALLAGLIAGSILVSSAAAQSPAPAAKPSTTGARAHYRPNALPKRAAMYYSGYWGVDSLSVRMVESGELIRFTFRVLDPVKAKSLNDKEIEPSLIDPQAGVSLVVPQLEKVGKLRNINSPEAGKSYWMAFSNPGRRVKRGDHVIVVIGQFKAQGLIVE